MWFYICEWIPKEIYLISKLKFVLNLHFNRIKPFHYLLFNYEKYQNYSLFEVAWLSWIFLHKIKCFFFKGPGTFPIIVVLGFLVLIGGASDFNLWYLNMYQSWTKLERQLILYTKNFKDLGFNKENSVLNLSSNTKDY